MNKPPIPEHLFVKSPYSGKLINVLPLLELMDDSLCSRNGPRNLIGRVQMIHDFVSTNVPRVDGSEVNSSEWASINYLIVQLRQTFEQMQETPG